jgi:hypothetical protein
MGIREVRLYVAKRSGTTAHKSFPRPFFAFCERSGNRSGGLRHGTTSPVEFRVVDLAKLDGGAHEAKAAGGHPPAPGTGNLGHQPIGVEAREEAADLAALPGHLRVWQFDLTEPGGERCRAGLGGVSARTGSPVVVAAPLKDSGCRQHMASFPRWLSSSRRPPSPWGGGALRVEDA